MGVHAAKSLSVDIHMGKVHRLGQCQPVGHKLMVFEKVCPSPILKIGRVKK